MRLLGEWARAAGIRSAGPDREDEGAKRTSGEGERRAKFRISILQRISISACTDQSTIEQSRRHAAGRHMGHQGDFLGSDSFRRVSTGINDCGRCSWLAD